MKKFNIGDIVEIYNTGGLYTTYADMAKLLKLSNWQYKQDFSARLPSHGNVIAKRYHELCDVIVYGIELLNGEHYLFDDSSLKPYKPVVVLSDSLFELN